MHDLPAHDGDRQIDWGKTSSDYADWRPDYPAEFYDRLASLGIGVPDQRILDLATGVGFLARNFANPHYSRAQSVDVFLGEFR